MCVFNTEQLLQQAFEEDLNSEEEAEEDEEKEDFFQDTLDSLTFLQKKALCIQLQRTFSKYFTDNIHAPLTDVFGFCSSTLYKWTAEFNKTHQLLPSVRGQHWKRWTPILDEEFARFCREWYEQMPSKKESQI